MKRSTLTNAARRKAALLKTAAFFSTNRSMESIAGGGRNVAGHLYPTESLNRSPLLETGHLHRQYVWVFQVIGRILKCVGTGTARESTRAEPKYPPHLPSCLLVK